MHVLYVFKGFSKRFDCCSTLLKKSISLNGTHLIVYVPSARNFSGQRFALREGGRTVGAGVVSKVLS